MKRTIALLALLFPAAAAAQSLCPAPIVFRSATATSPYSITASANLTVAQQDSNINAIEELLCKPNAITASHLKSVDAGADEECLTRETTTGDFEWQACGGGTFLSLTDTPSDYAGDALKLVRVNAGETALEFTTAPADDDVPEVGDFGALALSGDVTSSGLVTTVAANSVALTTDTTGNYAAGDAEAGAALTGDTATAFFSAGEIEDARIPDGITVTLAATATALAANGANCGAGNYPLGVDASGAVENCTAVTSGDAPGGADGTLQYRVNSTTLGGVTSSSVSGADVVLGGSLTLNTILTPATNTNLTLNPHGTGRVNFGGTASSDPALHMTTYGSTAALRVVTADFSAGANMIANTFVSPNETTPTAQMTGGVVEIASNAVFGARDGTNLVSASRDTGLSRISAGMYGFGTGAAGSVAGGMAASKARMVPTASPPVTCGDANTLGYLYTDTSLALCFCDGTAWQVLNTGTVGVGTCA